MNLIRLAALAAVPVLAQAPPEPRPVSRAQFSKWMAELNNWGRWGKEDQKGALNLITAESRKRASRLVREGVAVSLSHDAEKQKAPDNPRPFVHEMLSTSRTPNAMAHSDQFTIAHHGLAHTHLDSLCHVFWEGKMYNGFPVSEVTESGAAKLAVTNAKTGIYARGVLMDMAENEGVPWLEPGTPIYPEDLEAWERKARVKVGQGDVLLIRTGRWAHRAAKGAQPLKGLSGLHASCIPWLKQRDVAVVGSDAAMDVRPSGVDGVTQPIHIFSLAGLGAWILDNVDLEDLSQEAKQRRRWEFLITASPLAVPGATGSALNPIALF